MVQDSKCHLRYAPLLFSTCGILYSSVKQPYNQPTKLSIAQRMLSVDLLPEVLKNVQRVIWDASHQNRSLPNARRAHRVSTAHLYPPSTSLKIYIYLRSLFKWNVSLIPLCKLLSCGLFSGQYQDKYSGETCKTCATGSVSKEVWHYIRLWALFIAIQAEHYQHK